MELACCDGVDVFPHLNKRSILQQQKFAGITCYDANEMIVYPISETLKTLRNRATVFII